MEAFCAELAGVVIGIRCACPETRLFLKDYETEKEAAFTVEAEAADLKWARAELDRQDGAEGREPRRRAGSVLEKMALHRLLAEGLTEYGVLLVHGSALALDGAGCIFTAPSGTGKSTHAALWRRVFGERVLMLNDDKPLLRVGAEGVTVYGSPWDGKHHLSRNASAPLRAVARIVRAAENKVEPLPKDRAFQVLMTQAYASRDPAVMARILRLEQQILDQVPFFDLRCNMEPEAARVACAAMGLSGP